MCTACIDIQWRGDRISEREKLYLCCAGCGTQAAEFLGHKFWEGYFASTVERDEKTMCAYIGNQDIADKQSDQIHPQLAFS